MLPGISRFHPGSRWVGLGRPTAPAPIPTSAQRLKSILGFSPILFLGQSLAEYRLDPNTIAQLQSALSTEAFPFEIHLNFLSSNDEVVPVLMSVSSRAAAGNGNPARSGLRGFVRVLTGSNSLPQSIVAPDHLQDLLEMGRSPRLQPPNLPMGISPSGQARATPPNRQQGSPLAAKSLPTLQPAAGLNPLP